MVQEPLSPLRKPQNKVPGLFFCPPIIDYLPEAI